jgi:hypothetical protein
VIDSVFYNEDRLHNKSSLPELYYRAVTPEAPVAPVEPPASDTTAPTVSIDAPTAGTTVSDLVTVSAQAADEVGVTSVQFQLDGTDLGAAVTATPYSVTWDPATATDGAHELTAIASDAAGNTRTSSPVTVTVQHAAPPGALVTLLGSESVGGNADFNNAGVAEAFRMTAGVSGSLQKLNVYLATDSMASSVLVGVYSDDGGRPGVLLTSTALSSPAPGWNAVSVPLLLPITAETNYWIALLSPSDAGQVRFQDSGGSGTPAVVDDTAGSELPLTWTTTRGPWFDGPLSVFGTT